MGEWVGRRFCVVAGVGGSGKGARIMASNKKTSFHRESEEVRAGSGGEVTNGGWVGGDQGMAAESVACSNCA